MPYNRRFRHLLVSLSVLGALVILLGTARGVGLSPDSALYVNAARNLVHGRGLVITFDSDEARPLTQYPPLYPALLAAGGLLDADPQDAARYINAALFGALIWLVGGAVYRHTRSAGIAAAAALFVLASIDLIHAYSIALSEAPFIVAGLLSLVLLGAHLQESRKSWLVAAAAAAACSFLARYPGVAFVAAGTAGILLLGRRPLRRRLADASIFATVGGLPAAAWVARNWVVAHTVSINVRSVATTARPILGSALRAGLETVSAWALPSPAPSAVRLSVLALLAAGAIALGALALAAPRSNENREAAPEMPALPFLLLLFIVIYLPLIVVSILTTGQGFLDRRFLAPVYVALVICLASVGRRLSARLRGTPALRAAAVTMAALAVIYGLTAAGWTLASYVIGLGYAARSWTESALIAQVRELPGDTRVYSNAADAVYLLTRRSAFWLPGADALATGADGRTVLASDLAEPRVRDGQAMIVFFDAAAKRPHALSRQQLTDALALRPVAQASDGTLFVAP